MKYYLDSAKLDEIDYAYKNYVIDGVTTNPKHIKASGKSFLSCINDIANWIKENNLIGKDVFPVSVEINPSLNTWEEIVAMAKDVSAISENFVIKIPCCEQGLIAAKKLESQGISTNVTLVFSASQAIAAAKLNAKFVSPFVGWKEDSGENAMEYVKDIVNIYKNYNYKTEIIVAALRTGKQIVDAALMGADIVTCSLNVYKASFEHPFTKHGIAVFSEAWDNTAE